MKEITEDGKIRYIEAMEEPLSADIGVISLEDSVWLYDVGNGEGPLSSLNGHCNVVLSHFHPDHTGNIGKLDLKELYLSKETLRHLPKDLAAESIRIVTEPIIVDGLRIFPIPSSHAKGSLGLEVDGRFAFVGDALYSSCGKRGFFYNAQLLREEIDVLKSLDAPYLLVSHRKGLVRRKDEVISELEEIYGRREKGSCEIPV